VPVPGLKGRDEDGAHPRRELIQSVQCDRRAYAGLAIPQAQIRQVGQRDGAHAYRGTARSGGETSLQIRRHVIEIEGHSGRGRTGGRQRHQRGQRGLLQTTRIHVLPSPKKI